MELNTTMSIDLDQVKEFIQNDKFVQFLLNNTTDFGVAAYILQTLQDCIERDKESLNGTIHD